MLSSQCAAGPKPPSPVPVEDGEETYGHKEDRIAMELAVAESVRDEEVTGISSVTDFLLPLGPLRSLLSYGPAVCGTVSARPFFVF